MATRRSRPLLSLAVAATLILSAALPSAAVENGGSRRSGPNTARAVVLLESPSTATAVGSAHGAAADAHRAEVAAERAAFKDWLAQNVPQARVIWEYDTVLNGVSVELNGASAAALANGPGVRDVLTPTWMSPTMDESLEIINWQAATGQDPALAGRNVGQDVLVGIIDTGIDEDHPFFEVNESNAAFYTVDGTVGGACTHSVPADDQFQNFEEMTSCKVIVAKVFNSDTSFTPEDFHGHGTHVAGTAAGNSGTVSDTAPGGMSGVAPAAVLGNYNVFPSTTGSASSDDIAMGVDEAVRDGMDVLNLSLGGTPEARYDALDLALRSAEHAGVISAVAAGNSGPGAGTVESPGWTPWVLTAGASTNQHFNGQLATHAIEGDAGAAVGDFIRFPEDTPLSAPYVWWDTIDGAGAGEACENRPLRANLSGKIALIKRGACTFTTKVRNAQSIGAVGAVIFNQVAGDPVAMGHDGTEFPQIPAVMVSKTYGNALTAHSGSQLSVGGPVTERDGTPDIIAGFSSRGPISTPDGLIVKPDMAAPGVNINSSVPGGGWAYFQGTSMATPHLAGAAAALIWKLGLQTQAGPAPDDPRDELIKSLLVNNSTDGVVKDHVTGNKLVGVNDEGSGRLDLDAAWDETFTADPVAFNVGLVNRGGVSGSATVTLSGDFGTSVVTFTDSSLAGVTPSVSKSPDGDQVTLTLTRKRGVRGDAEGVVTISNGSGSTIHLVYFGRFE